MSKSDKSNQIIVIGFMLVAGLVIMSFLIWDTRGVKIPTKFYSIKYDDGTTAYIWAKDQGQSMGDTAWLCRKFSNQYSIKYEQCDYISPIDFVRPNRGFQGHDSFAVAEGNKRYVLPCYRAVIEKITAPKRELYDASGNERGLCLDGGCP